jgi:3-methyl-2-oxobutanoate hydroxymethyltransferase
MQQVPVNSPSFGINDFKSAKNKARKIVMVTAYDYQSAQIIAQTNIDIILVGDSLGMVFQGKDNTLGVTLEDMLYHTRAVVRGAEKKFILSDMPFLSYHTDISNTVHNAGRLIAQAGADAVKVEINHQATIRQIEALVQAQIPVIAHIGMTPQSVNLFGGFKVQGKTNQQEEHIIDLALGAQQAGAAAIVVECVPAALTHKLTAQLSIPTIGIGAGSACDGQVLVINDLLGLSATAPKFAKQYLKGQQLITQALNSYAQEVHNGTFPSIEHSFK